MRENNATKLIALIIGAARMLAAVLTIALGAVVCGFVGVLGQGAFARFTMFWHRTMLRIFGATPVLRGAALVPGALVVCNHVSWMDILALGASWRVVFLGNSEISRWPILGWVIKRAGTLFIKRGIGANKATRDIAGELQQGRNVIVFPEGATTDGRAVIRFQPRLLQAAINAGAPLQPAALRYFDASGARVVRHSFVGNISLVGSAWKTARGPRIVAEITLFAPLATSEQRQELAGRAEQLVREVVESGSPRRRE